MELPETIYDQVSLHFPTSVETILPATHLANPTSLALNAVQWLLLAPLLSSHKEYDSILRSSPAPTGVGSRWDKYDDTSRTRGRGFGGAWAVSPACLFSAMTDGTIDTAAHRFALRSRFSKLGLPVHKVQNVRYAITECELSLPRHIYHTDT
jgi:hypothetical protein